MKMKIKVALVALLLSTTTSIVSGQEIWIDGPYPPQGSIYTDILIRIRGIPLYETFDLYIFWDDMNIRFEDHATDTNIWINPLNMYPYSNLGNHTVTLQLFIGGGIGYREFSFNWTITEYFPPTSEWWVWWENVPNEIKQELKGETGKRGEKGEKGDTGLRGEEGEKGDKGEQGVQGIQGETATIPSWILPLTTLNVIVSVVALTLTVTKRHKEKL